MKQDEQVRLLKHLIHQIDTGTNLDAGTMRKAPASAYTCPERAERERRLFFRERPQMIGMSGDLPENGSFLTRNDIGMSLLATRDSSGRFRAFVNACRHRGVAVEGEERGKRTRFMCPFHAWTYSSEGELVNVPKPEHFGDVDRSCHGLVELPAVERYGVLLVHPDPQGEIDAEKTLEGLGPDFDSWGFADYAYVGCDTYDMPLNWKLAIDTFGETYHFGALHKSTLYPVFHGNVQGWDHWDLNHRMVLCTRQIDVMRHKPESEWNIREGAFPVYWMFPNVMFNIGERMVIIVRVLPHETEVGRSVSQISFYVNPAVLEIAPKEALHAQATQTFTSVIRDEDYAAASLSQRSAESGLIDYFVFGRNEPTLHHYHDTYNKVLGLPPLEELPAVRG